MPGTVLAGRYRIVALLGRGGMGEVYRAEDLTLGQPVALKFLPEAANDEALLERFRGEVRIARRVSHPNVCRVYDIGEADGRHFLSMEYVDGEDLATLLRRIGRLPGDKALEVARRVCAGLAAAHEKGVLHRDLKPANVMLDSHGHVLITDFGLAALGDEVAEGDVRSGTPAFMAPEQLEGREVTQRSDIYSLGLVLYEIFTGKRAFEGKTFAEVTRTRSDTEPQSPSSLVRDLDPAVERAIMRCLERDPARRPASALAVAAALPGGDPLAAALAAGETPAPEVVAEAGESTGLRPRAALAALGAVVVGLALALLLGVRMSGVDRLGVAPPQVLALKAREAIRAAGYAPGADHASGFRHRVDFLRHVEKTEPGADWTAVLAGRPSPLAYWYRESPRPMVVLSFHEDWLTPGIVTFDDPPPTVSGMVNVVVDAQGRLTYLQAIPPEKDEAPSAPGPDWSALFAAAELDMSRLRPVEPQWVSLAASDRRLAWEGTWPGSARALRVEAASLRGRPVFFSLLGDWSKPARLPAPEDASRRAREVFVAVVGGTVLLGGILLAWRNYVAGKGDRRGAFRLAAVVFFLQLALWICHGHHLAGTEELGLLLVAMGNALFGSALVFAIYLSIEPYVRRRWPQAIISWSRLLAGRVRDPLLGRDLLTGVILGLVWSIVIETSELLIVRRGGAPGLGSARYLQGGLWLLGTWIQQVLGSVLGMLLFFFVIFLFRVLLRRPWLAGIAFVALYSTSRLLESEHLAIDLAMSVAVYGIAALAVVRFGLITLAAGIFTADLLLNVPITTSLGAWYAGGTVFPFLSVLALAAWAFYTSLGGQRLLSGELFE